MQPALPAAPSAAATRASFARIELFLWAAESVITAPRSCWS